MKSLVCALLLSSLSLAHTGNVATVSGSGSARINTTSTFTFNASATKTLENAKYKYLGSLSLQTSEGRDVITVSIPDWSEGTWSGNQANLVAWATVSVLHAGRTTVYHGVANVLFIDNKHGQNAVGNNPPPGDCVCLSWKDKTSSLSYYFLGTVERGGSVTVKD